MSGFFKLAPATVLLITTGCASLPSGPSVMVLPGSGLSFNRFRSDDIGCQQYAYSQVDDETDYQSMGSGVGNVIVGTLMGAALGAAIGGRAGAAIGAGTGLLGGNIAAATGAASRSSYEAQQRYDAVYIQCMYALGHQVPVSGSFSTVQPRSSATSTINIPPPPPGLPPPPPKK